MLEFPVHIRIRTENDIPYFSRPSNAEAVIGALINMQQQGWLRLHGFVLLPNELEMVASLIKQGAAGTIAQLQAETIPPLSVLQPNNNGIWAMKFTQDILKSQRSFDARLEMLRLAPVANGIVEDANRYPYSSANERYRSAVAVYAGYTRLVTGELRDPSPQSTPSSTSTTETTPTKNGSVNSEIKV